jgi:hypothetical protein
MPSGDLSEGSILKGFKNTLTEGKRVKRRFFNIKALL